MPVKVSADTHIPPGTTGAPDAPGAPAPPPSERKEARENAGHDGARFAPSGGGALGGLGAGSRSSACSVLSTMRVRGSPDVAVDVVFPASRPRLWITGVVDEGGGAVSDASEMAHERAVWNLV